jgi:hypothetical protein
MTQDRAHAVVELFGGTLIRFAEFAEQLSPFFAQDSFGSLKQGLSVLLT